MKHADKLVLVLLLVLSACTSNLDQNNDAGSLAQAGNEVTQDIPTATVVQESNDTRLDTLVVEYDQEDLVVHDSSAADTYINLQGDQISLQGSGATVEGANAVITSPGVYSIQGTLNDGQIIVDTQEEETVVLLLDGARITSLTSAPIYVRNAEKVVITLVDGTDNEVADGSTYAFDEADEPNAAIFSKADLTINGTGALTVSANFNNGIASKDDLLIVSGTIAVNAANDGIKGRDSVGVIGGSIFIDAGGDGIQSNNDVDAERGNVYVEGGSIQITAALDGIQAVNTLVVSGGDLVITTGGGSVMGASIYQPRGDRDWQNQEADSASTVSAKGLKAGVNVSIYGGSLNINAADDAIHSNDTILVYAGEMQLASGDDGLHADSVLEIHGGNLNITQCYEGIESADIRIMGGTIHLLASDDGLNAVSGDGGAAMGQQFPGPGGGFEAGDSSLVISGGYIYIDAGGDGMDINGPIEMTDGTVLINGPTNAMNGAIDYTGGFNIAGGLLVAAGSAGMAMAPSASSSQLSVLYNFTTVLPAGTVVHIASQSGGAMLTFIPTKEYQSVVVSSPDLASGETYLVFTGGSANGTMKDGLLSDGSFPLPITHLQLAF